MASAANFPPTPSVTPPHSPSKSYHTASRSPSKFAALKSSQQSVPFNPYSTSTSSLTTTESKSLNKRANLLVPQPSLTVEYENVSPEVSFSSLTEDCSSDRTSDAYVITPRAQEDSYVTEAIAPTLSRVGFDTGYLSSSSLRSSDYSYVTTAPTHSRVGFDTGYLPSSSLQTQAGQPSTPKKPKLKLDPETPSKAQLWENVQEFASKYLSPEKSPQKRDLVVTTLDGVPLFKLESLFVCPAGTEIGSGYTRKAQLALTTKKGSPASSSQDWVVLSTQKIKTDKQFKIAQSEDKILKKVKEKLELYPFTKGIFKFQDVFYHKDNTGETTQFLLSDYYNGGDLSAHLSQIPQASVPKIMYELIDAVCFLHLIAFIFHSDIKAANVLVRLNSLREIEEVGLGDFGFSCNMEDPEDLFYKNGDASTISTEFSLKRSMHRHNLKATMASSSAPSQTTEVKGFSLTDEIFKEDVYALGVLFENLCKNFPNHPYKLLINTMKASTNARRPGIEQIKEMFSKIHPEFTFQYNKKSAV